MTSVKMLFSHSNNEKVVEVPVIPDELRRHLATACCAKLILECLERKLYPSWDAQNIWSVHLAKKLGYELSHEYIAYEVI